MFDVVNGDESFSGSQDEKQQTVVIRSDVRAAATFARWFRTRVPLGQPLIVFDEAYSHEVAVLANTTEEELFGPFLA